MLSSRKAIFLSSIAQRPRLCAAWSDSTRCLAQKPFFFFFFLHQELAEAGIFSRACSRLGQAPRRTSSTRLFCMHSVHISLQHALTKDSCPGSIRSSQNFPAAAPSVIFRHCQQHQQRSPNSASTSPAKRATGCIIASSSQSKAQQAARLAVFVSGGGSNLKAIHRSVLQDKLRAVIQVMLVQVADVTGSPFWVLLQLLRRVLTWRCAV